MEDFGSILWIIAIVGAMLFSANSKARKKAREAAKRAIRQLEEEGRRHEAWPSWDTPEEPAEYSGQEYPEAVSLETAEPEVPETETGKFARYTPAATVMESGFETAAREAASARKTEESRQGNRTPHTPGTACAVSGTSAAAAPAPDAIAPEEFAAEIREDFDLRRAVIYSEILKPKFIENEAE